MGESVVEATIGSILKPSGAIVRAEEEILEIETDKVNQVLYAPADGQMQFSVKAGDVVKVGQTIGFVDTSRLGRLWRLHRLLLAKNRNRTPPQVSETAQQPIPLLPARKKSDEALQEIFGKPQRSCFALSDVAPPPARTSTPTAPAAPPNREL